MKRRFFSLSQWLTSLSDWGVVEGSWTRNVAYAVILPSRRIYAASFQQDNHFRSSQPEVDLEYQIAFTAEASLASGANQISAANVPLYQALWRIKRSTKIIPDTVLTKWFTQVTLQWLLVLFIRCLPWLSKLVFDKSVECCFYEHFQVVFQS